MNMRLLRALWLWVISDIRTPYLWLRERQFRRDEALIVSFLAERGASHVLSISIQMQDHTRGRHDWMLRSDRRLYRLLDRMEADGTIVRRITPYGAEYVLRAAPGKLLKIV